ncbi:right-handed parallel beta-helix repeat-containing protein [Clostridium uliginosum]|uniref:Right handed beta helix region n=1 Tax=Clostridium uliginosum TaxID=119641 RepID=A0A1I1S647_9CLOT|nr:right-handed parallel beta-helix repeat-containing protein [Clostridium uliginosum]SFD41985.1 Right handed beta helix region [Clostridium uliginosum]
MIQNVNDLINNINKQEKISLVANKYIFTSLLIIGNTSNIIGNGSTLMGPILICTDVIISNITFSNFENIISITSDCSVTFNDCTFLGNNENTAITLEKEFNSSINLENCMFSNFLSGISINENNTLSLLKNCSFQFCTTAIDKVVSNSSIKISSITNNFMFNSNDAIFLKFNESFHIEDYYNFCFELCSNNNYARIFGEVNNQTFDTACFYVDTLKELNSVLNTCSHCATVFLKDGMYELNEGIYTSGILIATSIHLIGINSPTLYKAQLNSIEYAITINTSNVIIENLKIDGGENYALRDGIHFEELGGLNIKIKNIDISRIARRGISVWGKDTCNCTISNCKFTYIKEQCAIYCFKNLFIYKCSFKNLKVALNCTANSSVTFEDNLFENIYCCLLNDNPSFNNIYQKNNIFNFVKNLFMLSEF